MKHRCFLLLLPTIALLSVGFCSIGKAQMTLQSLAGRWASCAAQGDEGYDFDIAKMKAELDYGRDKKFAFDGNTVTIGKRKLQVVGDTLVDGQEVFVPGEQFEKCPANGYVRPPKGNGFADFVNAVGTGMQIGMQQAPPSVANSSQTTLAQQQAKIQATAARDAQLRQQQIAQQQAQQQLDEQKEAAAKAALQQQEAAKAAAQEQAEQLAAQQKAAAAATASAYTSSTSPVSASTSDAIPGNAPPCEPQKGGPGPEGAWCGTYKSTGVTWDCRTNSAAFYCPWLLPKS